ncbi:MAG: thioredoxin family protein [Candidatus Kapaibacterium sp.]
MNSIKVLGPGCAKCKKLSENVQQALSQTKKELDFEYVTDIQKIMDYGILMTPGLVIDEKVVGTGRVYSVEEIINFLNS